MLNMRTAIILTLSIIILCCEPVFAGDEPRIIIAHEHQSGILLSWPNTHGYTFLESSHDLASWSNTAIRSTNQSIVIQSANTNSSFSKTFYRARFATREQMLNELYASWLYAPEISQLGFDKMPVSLPAWNNLLDRHIPNADGSPWVSKEVLGPASVGPYEIFRYDFTPVNPSKTVIVTGSMHGNEWLSTDILFRMFATIDKEHHKVPVLDYLRNHVHFVVIPLLNPWGYVHNDRRAPETEPIPVFWERNGNIATIKIDSASFPVTALRFTPENYITPDLANRLVISLQSSSDPEVLPSRGYKIESVIDDLRFTVTSENTGSVSGTAEFYVLTDINRQFDVNNWQGYSSLTWTDFNGVPHPNKGTRPYALKEAAYLRDLLHAHSNAVSYIDFHMGPPAAFSAYYGALDNFDRAPLDTILRFLSASDDDIYIGSNVLPSANSYAAQMLGMQSFTPETGGNTNAQKTLQWWLNILIAYSLLTEI